MKLLTNCILVGIKSVIGNMSKNGIFSSRWLRWGVGDGMVKKGKL